MWCTIFMIFREFFDIFFLQSPIKEFIIKKDLIVLGIVGILIIITIISNKYINKKKLEEENLEKEFEKFCENIPEIDLLLNERDLYLDEVMNLYTDLSAIQSIYNFTVHIKETSPDNYNKENLNKILENLDTTYKQLYIKFKTARSNLDIYQKNLMECYNQLKIIFMEEKNSTKNKERDDL